MVGDGRTERMLLMDSRVLAYMIGLTLLIAAPVVVLLFVVYYRLGPILALLGARG